MRGAIAFGFIIIATMACADRTVVRRQSETAQVQRLVGVWNVHMHLDQPLSIRRASSDELHIALALLPNPWLLDAYPEITAPTNYGTYDGDFSAFGFDPRDPSQVPAVIATIRAHDSVQVVLAPGRAETVILRGIAMGDSVTGWWQASVFHFGCGGRFTMRRR